MKLDPTMPVNEVELRGKYSSVKINLAPPESAAPAPAAPPKDAHEVALDREEFGDYSAEAQPAPTAPPKGCGHSAVGKTCWACANEPVAPTAREFAHEIVRMLHGEIKGDATFYNWENAIDMVAEEVTAYAAHERRELERTARDLTDVMEGSDNWRRKFHAAETKARDLERQLAESGETFRAMMEETVLAGYPGGDRAQTLANLRAMRARATELAEALRELLASSPVHPFPTNTSNLALWKAAIKKATAALAPCTTEEPTTQAEPGTLPR